MPHFDDVGYSESACITAINDYYNLLTSMYFQSSFVEWPPGGGWPQITSQSFSALGKSDRVLSLLRRMPYLRELDDLNEWKQPHAMPDDNFCNWKNQALANNGDDAKQMRQLKIITEGHYADGTTEHMFALMMISHRNNSHAIIDTQYGVVYWPDCDDGIKDETKFEQVTGEPEEMRSEREQDLRCEPCWTIETFFGMLKEQFLSLNWLPINSRLVIAAYDFRIDEELEPILKGIYRGHGWPDMERYRKEECMRLVEQTIKERDEAISANE